jgi:hypothetical protein
VSALERDLRLAGFTKIRCDAVAKPSGTVSSRDAAIGFCEGTPLRHEIVARDPSQLNPIIEEAVRRLKDVFGDKHVSGGMRAFVFTASK